MSLQVFTEDLKHGVEACLVSVGCNATDAGLTADALVVTDAIGVFTHGTKLLAGYLKKLQGGGYQPTARPRTEREGPGWAVVDGASALGQVGGHFSMQLAIHKARAVGIAYVGLRNAGHIGAAGYYAAMAAREGLIAMVTGNDIPSVAAPGLRLGGPFEIRPIDEETLARNLALDAEYRPAAGAAHDSTAETAKFACLGYISESAWEGRSKSEFDVMLQECVAYDVARRKDGHWLSGIALQSPETAKTVRSVDGNVSLPTALMPKRRSGWAKSLFSGSGT